jgi:hypothetical protein
MAQRGQVFAAQPLAYAGQRVIASPFQFATTEDDNLQIVSASSLAGVVLAIQGRRLSNAGAIEPFAMVHTPASDRSTRTENFKLGGGALLNLVIFAQTGSPAIGQTYASARIIRGLSAATVLLGGLLGGYVTAAQPLSYPGSPIVSSTDGEPPARFVQGTNPAGGSEISETVPTGARWELISFYAHLNTDASAGARRPGLVFWDGANPIYRTPQPLTVAPSSAGDFYWSQGSPFTTAVLPDVSVANLPTNNRLLAGQRVATATNALTAGDDYSTPYFVVKEWLEVQE